MTFSRSYFQHRSFRLSYLDSAPEDQQRPVVLLLHGFPDTATMWGKQIEALHAAGYRCIAPDTLGCGESEMAPRVRDYNCVKIASDHAALLDHLRISKAHVVGHDWGAVIAWLFAGYHPTVTERLVVMSVGHPTAYALSGARQKWLSWYTYFFQLGGLAEWLLKGEGALSLRSVFGSHPEMDEVMKRLREPGRMTAAVRLYRAAILPVYTRRQPNVSAPTLGLWSDEDRFLVESQMIRSDKYVDGTFRYERLSGHHWMSLQQPEAINRLLLEHLGSGRPSQL